MLTSENLAPLQKGQEAALLSLLGAWLIASLLTNSAVCLQGVLQVKCEPRNKVAFGRVFMGCMQSIKKL